jgi:hypothetical protein
MSFLHADLIVEFVTFNKGTALNTPLVCPILQAKKESLSPKITPILAT